MEKNYVGNRLPEAHLTGPTVDGGYLGCRTCRGWAAGFICGGGVLNTTGGGPG